MYTIKMINSANTFESEDYNKIKIFQKYFLEIILKQIFLQNIPCLCVPLDILIENSIFDYSI